MTPDLPKLRHLVTQFFARFVQDRAYAHLGFLSQVPRSTQWEGDSSYIRRADGSASEIEHEEMDAKMAVPKEASLKEILAALDGVAKELASKQAKYMFEKIGEASDAVGNTVDFAGRKVTAEALLDALANVLVDFDDSGRPTSQFVVGLGSPLPDILRRAEEDPVIRAKVAEYWARKYEEWRDREADRILAG